MSAPLWTSPAELRLEGDRLIASNGGWLCESGTVDGYVFRFVRDDGITSLDDVPPARETHEQAAKRLLGASNVLALRASDRGHSWHVECYAVSFSGAWGNEPAWAEWGGRSAAARDKPETYPNRSAFVLVPAQATTPPPPPPPTVTLETAQAKAVAALYELVEQWRRQGKTDEWIRTTAVYTFLKAIQTKGAQRVAVKDAIRGVLG